MTSAYEKVEICPKDGWPFQCKTAFEGETMGGRATRSWLFGPMNISWKDAHALTVDMNNGNGLAHIAVAIRGDADITIELVKEAHGNWPSTVPADRRMGSAPCL